MSEFDWSQDIKPDHRNGAGISGEELYQALIERMQREGYIEKKDSHGLSKAELRADSEGVHAPTCKAPFGVCTCSAGDNF